MQFFTNNNDLAATLLRVTVGLICMAHGVPKLLALVSGDMGFVNSMSAMFGGALIGWAIVLITIIVEALGGLLLVLGVRVRLSGLAVAALFFGIAVIMHGSDFPAMFGVGDGAQVKFEFPFLIAVGGLALAFLGSGRHALMRD
ncbi:MAG: DoxX family membrane protein [bacterium]|nr:DoxX family membrane protein [bacterium]